MPGNIAVDAAFLAQQAELREARAARFAAEAAKPPPPPPPKVLAHPGGKIVTSDKRTALLSLLARQTSPPTAAQNRALAELSAAPAPREAGERGRWPQQQSMSQPAVKRKRSIQCRRAPRLKLTPWGRRTCTATAFIFRRRRRLVLERVAKILLRR